MLSRTLTPATRAFAAPRAAAAAPVILRRPFSSSVAALSDPSKNRNSSEGTMPGGGSTDEIADSQGAFDSSTSRPEQA